MHREEDQRAEIEKIQRAVNESLRARRAFRVAKKQGCVVQQRPIVPTVERHHGAEPDASESLRNQPRMMTNSSISPHSQGSIPILLPLPDPWPSTFNNPQQWKFGDEALKNDSTITVNTLKLDSGASSRRESPQNGISYPFSFHPGAPPAENANDLETIMNYLDNIFPPQYYFYQPSAAERGRGWLLSMLLRSKPLYYTALAFSSVQKIDAARNDDASESRYLEELDYQHSLAMAGLAYQLEKLPLLRG